MTTASKAIRCAIYTRVSTNSGLDQEFNSLDAQYCPPSGLIGQNGWIEQGRVSGSS